MRPNLMLQRTRNTALACAKPAEGHIERIERRPVSEPAPNESLFV